MKVVIQHYSPVHGIRRFVRRLHRHDARTVLQRNQRNHLRRHRNVHRWIFLHCRNTSNCCYCPGSIRFIRQTLRIHQHSLLLCFQIRRHSFQFPAFIYQHSSGPLVLRWFLFISWNLSLAPGSFGFKSGWYFAASLRKAFLISSWWRYSLPILCIYVLVC